MATLLLEYSADVNAFAYCDHSMVERLYSAAMEAGAPTDLVRRGFNKYLHPEGNKFFVADNDNWLGHKTPEAVRLFTRVLSLGGQPSLQSIVCQEHYALIEDLFQSCPEKPGTMHDHPHGTVFMNLCDAASWMGYPQVFDLAMEICPQLHGPELARTAIKRALVSHNRDGSVDDYHQLITTQLNYLWQLDEMKSTIHNGLLLPHYLLAENYCWPSNYGFRASVSSPEGLIQLGKLFIEYSFEDLDRRHPETQRTPLAEAAWRGDHPGMLEYIEFLLVRGASLCHNDPDESCPISIAKRRLAKASNEAKRERLKQIVKLLSTF